MLLTLGAAYALLAAAYIGVQFLLGLRHRGSLLALALVALIEPVLLTGADDLESFARAVLLVQALAACVALSAAATARTALVPRPA